MQKSIFVNSKMKIFNCSYLFHNILGKFFNKRRTRYIAWIFMIEFIEYIICYVLYSIRIEARLCVLYIYACLIDVVKLFLSFGPNCHVRKRRDIILFVQLLSMCCTLLQPSTNFNAPLYGTRSIY